MTTRVFLFYKGKGKPFTLTHTNIFDEIIQQFKQFYDIPQTDEIHLKNEHGQIIHDADTILSDPDCLVYLVDGKFVESVIENQNVTEITTGESSRRESAADRRRRMREQRREEVQGGSGDDQTRLPFEMESHRNVPGVSLWDQMQAREVERSRVRSRVDVSEFDDPLQRKIAILEGFGDIHEARDVRVFLQRVNETPKVFQFEQYGSYTLDDMLRDVGELYQSKFSVGLIGSNGEVISDVNEIEPDDIIFVTLGGEENLVQMHINTLNKEKEDMERTQSMIEERKRRQREMKYEKMKLARMTPEEREEYERQKEIQNSLEDCTICFMDYKVKDMIQLKNCGHRFCPDCVRLHLETSVNHRIFMRIVSELGTYFTIRCPQVGCTDEIDIHDFKKIDRELFDRYDEILRDSAIDLESSFMWCPTAGCGNVLVTYEKDMIVCYRCMYSHCTKCNERWHQGPCGEELSMEWINSRTKLCPSCDTPIEKNGGCNHMTCFLCYFEFCWLCLGDYDNGRHFQTTRFNQFS
eukprot:TRINITY_DN7244_c0_g1_i1.p1 TRINITY_DN7244_c0_g1~~TRINITY_DN7244_c0_g1_i1.p1  ORF type:complete len:549 (-),score=106.96 TRINITY_DN7244_c0_g1_i1:56-1624(-)